jgi:FkbM family methyltransferase
MITAIKTKVKKLLLSLSGRFDHLERTVNIRKKWYGNSYGGFFVAPESLNESSIVYSFGIGEDISFDKTIIGDHHCRVFGFDPTPKSIAWIRKMRKDIPVEFSFFDYGIGQTTGLVDFYLPKNRDHVSGSLVNQENVDPDSVIQVRLKSFSSIVTDLGHSHVDVLKMDIEGAEYDVLDSILDSKIPISQIVVEFHDRFFQDGKLRTVNAIKQLKDYGFEIFGISDSFEEVSFINTTLVKPISD